MNLAGEEKVSEPELKQPDSLRINRVNNKKYDMNRENLHHTLLILARVFENSAEMSHIEEFKAKYSGVPWDSGVELSLLTYARNKITMERWIENLVNFMREKDITIPEKRIVSKVPVNNKSVWPKKPWN